MRTNKDGTRHLRDLRHAIGKRDDVSIHWESGWVVSTWIESQQAWAVSGTYGGGERHAIEDALGLPPTEQEATP